MGDYGPAIPFAGLGAVEDFFASLSWSGSMHIGKVAPTTPTGFLDLADFFRGPAEPGEQLTQIAEDVRRLSDGS
jgi:hypothetical protein